MSKFLVIWRNNWWNYEEMVMIKLIFLAIMLGAIKWIEIMKNDIVAVDLQCTCKRRCIQSNE